MRFSVSRARIEEEYRKLQDEGMLDRVNVVRTIAVRIGYKVTKNGDCTYVRSIIRQITELSDPTNVSL